MKRSLITFLVIGVCFLAAIYFDLIEITPKGMKYINLVVDTTLNLLKSIADAVWDLLKKGASMLGDLLKSIFDEVVSILKKWIAQITG